MISSQETKLLLTPEERHQILENLFDYFARAPINKNNITLTVNEKKFIDKYTSINKGVTSETYNALTDELLHILHNKPISSAYLYDILMQLLQKQNSDIDTKDIAEYLYKKRNYISFDVIYTLMKNANLKNSPEEALHYFDENFSKLPEGRKEQLYIQVIESFIIKENIDKALEICVNKINDLFDIYYNFQTQQFLHRKTQRELMAKDAYWKMNPLLSQFCLKLAIVLKKTPQQLSHTIAILRLLRVVKPEDSVLVIELGSAYRKNKSFNKALSLYNSYLNKHPDKIVIWVCYLTMLIDGKQLEQAKEISHQLLEEYSKTNRSLKKIKILHAWFFADAKEGKEIFNILRQEFPCHAMIAYLSIRYAIKIRDEQWKNQLIEETINQFANRDKDLVQIIQNLSQSRMICSVLENDYFSASDLLSDSPKSVMNFREVELPLVAVEAFQKFCTCSIKPCQSDCLDNVYLVGSSVPAIMDWNLAKAAGEPYDIIPTLNDLDFAAQVQTIPESSYLSVFEPCPYKLNLFTRKGLGNELDMDVRLYRMDPGSENSPNDIESITKHRDLTTSTFLLDSKGRVMDLIGGKAFYDYDNNILRTCDDPFVCLEEDPVRILRVANRLLEKQSKFRPPVKLDPQLEQALYKSTAPNWLEEESKRKKFLAKLTKKYAIDFLTTLQQFSLLGPAFGEPNLTGKDLLLHCLTTVSAYCRKHRILNHLNMLESQLEEKNRARSERKQLTQQEKDLKEENEKLLLYLKNTRLKVDSTKAEIAKLESINRKEINKKFKLWQNNYTKQQQKKYDLEVEVLTKSLNKLQNEAKNTNSSKQEQIKLIVKQKQIEAIDKIYSNFEGFFGSKKNYPEQNLKSTEITSDLDALKIYECNWSIDNVTNAFEHTSNLAFGAFLGLYLGCSYLYKQNSPLIAYYYFKLVEKRLLLIENNEIAKSFLNNDLSLLIDEAIVKSEFRVFPHEVLLKGIKSNENKSNPFEVLEQLAVIEYALTCAEISDDVTNWIFDNPFYLEHGDFLGFISLYDKALSRNFLTKIDSEKIDKMLNNNVEYHSNIECPKLWSGFIYKLQVIQMFPAIKLDSLFEYKTKKGMSDIDLIKFSVNMPWHDTPENKYRIFMQLGDIYSKNNAEFDACECFCIINNSIDGSKDPNFGFYSLWAYYQIKLINKKHFSSEFVYIDSFEPFLGLFKSVIKLSKQISEKLETSEYAPNNQLNI